MTRIFISYSRVDEAFARRLATSLSDMGADIWIDVEDIPAGVKWSSAIQEGLDSAQALIVIISPDSMASRNVEDEWQYFLDHENTVIPVLLRVAKVHFQLHRLQYVDFLNNDYDDALMKLYDELQRNNIIVSKPQRPQAPPTQAGQKAATRPNFEPPVPTEATVPASAVDRNRSVAQVPSSRNTSSEKNDGTPNRTLLIGMVIGIALIGIVGVFGFGLLGAEDDPVFANNATQIQDDEITQEAATPTDAPTATPTDAPTTTPTDAPTSTPTETAPPIFDPRQPIANNEDWEPIQRSINGLDYVLVPPGRVARGVTQENLAANTAECAAVFNGNCPGSIVLTDELFNEMIVISEPFWIQRTEMSYRMAGSLSSDDPKVDVTSDDAQAICVASGARLPSEVEWEYAAKGPSNWRYPWGNQWDNITPYANICDASGAPCGGSNPGHPGYDDGFFDAAPVGTFTAGASWVGALDMAGNVWEWTSDRYNSSTNALRGSAWIWILAEATTTSRAAGIARSTSFYGFRCARDYREGDLERYSE